MGYKPSTTETVRIVRDRRCRVADLSRPQSGQKPGHPVGNLIDNKQGDLFESPCPVIILVFI